MRYLGSKESLTEPIIQLLAEKGLLQRNMVFFDAFCGMGSVSDAIKSSYDHVVIRTRDILHHKNKVPQKCRAK